MPLPLSSQKPRMQQIMKAFVSFIILTIFFTKKSPFESPINYRIPIFSSSKIRRCFFQTSLGEAHHGNDGSKEIVRAQFIIVVFFILLLDSLMIFFWTEKEKVHKEWFVDVHLTFYETKLCKKETYEWERFISYRNLSLRAKLCLMDGILVRYF